MHFNALIKWLQCVQCANQQAIILFFVHVLYIYVNVQDVYNVHLYISIFKIVYNVYNAPIKSFLYMYCTMYNVQCKCMSMFKMCTFQHSKCLQCVQCANQQASHQRRSPDDSDIIISHKIPSLTNRFDSWIIFNEYDLFLVMI